MKTSTRPPLRVVPALREQIKRVLHAGESVSSFVDSAVRQRVRARIAQEEFVARGLAALAAARESGEYVTADQAIAQLQRMLANARASTAPPR